jgi:hypothetical protein
MGFVISESGFEMTPTSKEVNTPGIWRKNENVNAFSNAFAAALGASEPKSDEEKEGNKLRRQEKRAIRKEKRADRRTARATKRAGKGGGGKGGGKGLLIAGAIGGLIAAISTLQGNKKNKGNGNIKLPEYKTTQSYKKSYTKPSNLNWNPHNVSSKFYG